ncbi:MAG: hypothetical protein KDD99_21800 [Bacteroidetes bacterium]|nr:hypothetical protein [Bacteroidota bacterium]
MHDLDRTTIDNYEHGYSEEFANEFMDDFDDELDDSFDDEFDDEFDNDYDDEFDDEYTAGYDDEFDDEFDEEYDDDFEDEYEDEFDDDEFELAAELMEVADDEELEEFLGKIIGSVRKIFGKGKKIVKSPMVRKQWRAHQARKKKLLPIFQKIFGSYFGGGGGGGMGSKFFEIGLEGLSPEERRFEVAKNSAKFMKATLRHLPKNPGIPAKTAVRKALKRAARRHMPQLLKSARRRQRRRIRRMGIQGNSGRWIRTKRGIVLLGA